MTGTPLAPGTAPVRVGVIGLGRAFMLMLAAFDAHPSVELVAACAPRVQSRDAFAARYPGAFVTDSVVALCERDDIDAVYIATPHQMHRDHIVTAVDAAKHVLVDKPMAISMADANAIVAAVMDSSVQLVVGPSHSFDMPVRHARALLQSGRFGAPRMIHAVNFTDFLYRPRRPEELDTAQGGGVVFSQAAHQVDVVRMLALQAATSVYAVTGNWDVARSTEGAYSALIHFGDELFASIGYSGYAHFDSDEWMDWIGELGHEKSPHAYGGARRALTGARSGADETQLKSARTFGSAAEPAAAQHHEHFGPLVICTEKADLRLTPKGIWIYDDCKRYFEPTPPSAPRAAVLDALVQAVRNNVVPVQCAQWGRATIEVCHAILASARERQPVALGCQAVPDTDTDTGAAN